MILSQRVGHTAAALALVAASGMSFAQGLLGSTVTGTLLYPSINDVLRGPLVAVVGQDVEFPAGAFVTGRNFSIDVGATQIVYRTGETTTYGLASFNGFGLTFEGAPTITSVSVDASTSTFEPVSYGWNGNSLYFNLAGLGVVTTDQLTFNVSAVPEAASLWLMLCGAVVLAPAVVRRRRASR